MITVTLTIDHTEDERFADDDVQALLKAVRDVLDEREFRHECVTRLLPPRRPARRDTAG